MITVKVSVDRARARRLGRHLVRRLPALAGVTVACLVQRNRFIEPAAIGAGVWVGGAVVLALAHHFVEQVQQLRAHRAEERELGGARPGPGRPRHATGQWRSWGGLVTYLGCEALFAPRHTTTPTEGASTP